MFPLATYSKGRSFVQSKNGDLRNSGPWKGPQTFSVLLNIKNLLYITVFLLQKDLTFLLCSHNRKGQV